MRRRPCQCGARALQLYQYAGFRWERTAQVLVDAHGRRLGRDWIERRHARATVYLLVLVGPRRWLLAWADLLAATWTRAQHDRERDATLRVAQYRATQLAASLNVPTKGDG